MEVLRVLISCLKEGIIYVPLSLGLFCRPVSLMDKTMDSGSIDVGSIPTRGTSFEYRLYFSLCSFTMRRSFDECALRHGYC